ncbi:MAG: hypothetical protein COX62_02500 [Deltaproteobacteria bacterium CG_4_10_14_0_2_um_filter_43_8]|nr:MAG: hypothetical protein COV43_00445 [Deltaproteobacteria bacterium CG11_big_fil_rev_8_21_14_0_20_42_23]PJA21424.1 MAG: hypothetical protein COX62_02500 [Deltaproteobacteria bacterium CG_4_10_14_0_2_um_filter_43_8]PJC64706.1 MAG: hypothetical protein CO021_02925 [Deltaproteobacteria bacterium CG_4_9_14_0_2_um_filter_42_21]
MRGHHTKEKGDLGVLKAQVDLHQQGFTLLNPVTEHAPFDLVIYRNGIFKSVQVKYKSLDKTGSLTLGFRTCWTDKNGTHMRAINKEEVDLYCVYCPDTDECYYFDPKRFNKTVTLRVSTPKNNQLSKINKAADYRWVP